MAYDVEELFTRLTLRIIDVIGIVIFTYGVLEYFRCEIFVHIFHKGVLDCLLNFIQTFFFTFLLVFHDEPDWILLPPLKDVSHVEFDLVNSVRVGRFLLLLSLLLLHFLRVHL
jgi:hypothetical protein